MSTKTKRITSLCESLVKDRKPGEGAIVLSIVDYVDFWDEIEPELREFRTRPAFGYQAATIGNHIVIQRDEHEGEPRWAPSEEILSWSH